MSPQLKKIATTLVVALALIAGPLLAHPMIVKGTVAAVEPKRIQVRTGEEKKDEVPAWHVIDAKTKIMREKTVMTFEEAKIATGERVVLNLDHDADGKMKTIEIHLAAR